MTKKIIGRSDIISFPEFGFNDIKAKVDTGAYTSSIRCSYVKEVKDGEELEFKLLSFKNYPQYANVVYKTSHFKSKKVKNTSGIAETRYLIKTEIEIGDVTYPCEFTLSERKGLKFPVLLGRKFLNGNFIVDTTKKNILSKK